MKRLKGVYTVEATVIISLCFILFGIAVGLTYNVYEETVFCMKADESSFDAVNCFRKKEMLEDLKDIILGDE